MPTTAVDCLFFVAVITNTFLFAANIQIPLHPAVDCHVLICHLTPASNLAANDFF
jgi:hypothetical protein